MKRLALLALVIGIPMSKAEPNLIGGTPANAADWPASVYASMNGAACSATIVGDRVLLMASHCVDDGGTARFSAGANAYTARCSRNPGYRGDSTADWALCLIDRPVTAVKFERLATDATKCRVGMDVRLTGYGCIRAGGGGGNDGVYRIGMAKVESCPSSNNDLITKGASALCYGDSGGPAFFESADGSREVLGVNSRGDIKTVSYLSTIFTPAAKTFITAWTTTNSVKICGVHADATGCRDIAIPPPPPTPPPTNCLMLLERTGRAFDDLKNCLETQGL